MAQTEQNKQPQSDLIKKSTVNETIVSKVIPVDTTTHSDNTHYNLNYNPQDSFPSGSPLGSLSISQACNLEDNYLPTDKVAWNQINQLKQLMNNTTMPLSPYRK